MSVINTQHVDPNATNKDLAITQIPIVRLGSVTTSARLLAFRAKRAFEIVSLRVAPTTIASGTLKVDVLVEGVSVMSTKATATVADTPVEGVFSTTRIAAGEDVLIATTSDSSTVTDVLGMLEIRPLCGAELRE